MLSVIEKTLSGATAFTLAEVFSALISDVKQTFCFRDNSASHRQERVRENKMFVFAFTLAEVLYSEKLYSCAFTLAEVLIVLGIIGLIADMTIPTVVAKTQEKINVVKLKKAHATFENAFRLAVSENGTPENWGLINHGNGNNPDSTGVNNFMNAIKPYLNFSKICYDNAGCFPGNPLYKGLDGRDWNHYDTFKGYSKAVLADGTTFLIANMSPACDENVGTSKALQSVCGDLLVDTNGPLNQPNVVGRDWFRFRITKYGIIPTGTSEETGTNSNFDGNCRDKDSQSGEGCTAWVIYNENMDYLHCKDLSWTGQKTCK